MKSSKKLLSGLLATAMAATFVLPAAAAPVTGDITVPLGLSGSVAVPVIDMELPTFNGSSVIFDIYNQLGNGQQVISPGFEFVNNSAVPVVIKLKEYSVVTDNATGITSETDPTALEADTTRKMLLWINEAEKDTNASTHESTYKLDADGNKTYPAYNKTAHDKKVFTTFLKSGDPVTATQPADPYLFSRMARGSEAVNNNGTITTIPLDQDGILLDRNKTTIRFDGMLNKTATWGEGEAITITPVFVIEPQSFDPSGVDEEPVPAPSPATLTCTPPSASSLSLVAGGPIVVTSSKELKATLAAEDYSVVIKSADGNTTRVVNGAATVTVGGTNNDTVTIKQRFTGVIATDKIIVTLKASAFKNPAMAQDSTFNGVLA